MNGSGVTPGGMGRRNWMKFNADIDRMNYQRLGYVETKYGTVYMAERFEKTHWVIMWAARDMLQEIECNRFSGQQARKQAALNAAFHSLHLRAETFGEA